MTKHRFPHILTLSALLVGGGLASNAYAAGCPYPLTDANRPIASPNATAEHATFTDPTAETSSEDFVKVSEQIYIAPFAKLEAQSATDNVCIEHASNVQDNTLIKANGGPVNLGVHSIMAHGSQLEGDGTPVSMAYYPKYTPTPVPSYAGFDASCSIQPPPRGDASGPFSPDHPSFNTAEQRGRQALGIALVEYAAMPGGKKYRCGEVPAFISFNALNNFRIEDGALLSATSRLTRGVILRGGYTSHPGKSLNTQLEADTASPDFVNHKVRYVVAGDIAFMQNVIHVNECLAKGYTRQYRDTAGSTHPYGGPDSVQGVGIDPGSYHHCEFNDDSERPTIGYHPDADLAVRNMALAVHDPNPSKKIRIIGDVRVAIDGATGTTPVLDIDKIQDHVSIRADEGEPFTFRSGVEFGFANTFHSLEKDNEDPNREIRLQRGVKLEERVVVHGGGRRQLTGGVGEETTRIGEYSNIGKDVLVFRSDIEPGTWVGAKSVLAGYSNCTSPRGPTNDPAAPCHPNNQSPYPAPEVIPDRCVKFIGTARDTCAYSVEW